MSDFSEERISRIRRIATRRSWTARSEVGSVEASFRQLRSRADRARPDSARKAAASNGLPLLPEFLSDGGDDLLDARQGLPAAFPGFDGEAAHDPQHPVEPGGGA